MHPELSNAIASVIQADRLREAKLVRSINVDGADWPSAGPQRKRSHLGPFSRERSKR